MAKRQTLLNLESNKYICTRRQTNTYSAKEAIRSEVEKLRPALHFVKLPEAVSNDRSVPKATVLLPATPEKLTRGLAVSPMPVLIPAYSCKYWSSTCNIILLLRNHAILNYQPTAEKYC